MQMGAADDPQRPNFVPSGKLALMPLAVYLQ
jgi:hypothetical protein